MAFLNTQIRVRDGKVTSITIPEDQLQELKFLESKTNTGWSKEAMQCCLT